MDNLKFDFHIANEQEMKLQEICLRYGRKSKGDCGKPHILKNDNECNSHSNSGNRHLRWYGFCDICDCNPQ